MRLRLVNSLFVAVVFSSGAFASTWVPINVGEITTFVPLPSVEELEIGSFSSNSSVSIQVGSTESTQAYYFRQLDSYGQYGAWQCQTADVVAANSDSLIIDDVSAGVYSYQVSACMTGDGCEIDSFENGALACSETIATASIEVLDNSGTRTPSVSSSLQEFVGTTAAQFRVDESGAATYNVPIALPSGTAGVQPQVSLSYSSQGGDGYMGRGWNISGMGAISRCPKTYVHDGVIDGVKFASTDRLCLNGQRLILDGKSDDKTTSDANYWATSASYHTEVDTYTYIKPHYSGSVLKGFTVQNKAGEVHYYGSTTGITGNSLVDEALSVSFKTRSDVTDTGEDAFVQIASNANLAKMWALKAIKDVKNNYILYRYNEYASSGEHYIDEIQYTGNTDQSLLPYARVKFHYEENSKQKSGWQAGEPVSLTQLLDKVEVIIDDAQYREYNLAYYTSDFLEEKNYLEYITECVDGECLVPLSFEWLKRDPVTTDTSSACYDIGEEEDYCFDKADVDAFEPFTTSSTSATSTSNPFTAKVFDINADGYADIVYVQSGAWKVKLGPTFSTTETLYSGKTNKPEYALIMDYNGDGVQDLMVANSTSDNWTILSYNTTFETEQVICPRGCYSYTADTSYKVTSIPATGLEGKTQILDVDGDALTDIVMASGQNLIYYRNKGDGTFESSTPIIALNTSSSLATFNEGITSRTGNLKNASALDVNGDGRSDILFERATTTMSCRYYPNVTSGSECESLWDGDSTKWETKTTSNWYLYVSTGNSSYTEQQEVAPGGTEPRVVDLNGDGLSDIMWLSGNNWKYRLSNGLQFMDEKWAFKDETSTKLYTVSDSHDYAFFIDVSADGRTDLLMPYDNATNWTTYFSRPLPGSPDEVIFESRGTYSFDKSRSFQFGDVNGDGKLDFLQAASGGKWYVHKGGLIGQAEDVIDTFDNGFGVQTQLVYGNITDENLYYAKDSNNRYDSSGNELSDYFSPKSGYFAVKKATTDTGDNSSNSVQYQYGGLLLHKKGRGMLGFERIRTLDLQTCTTKEEDISVFDPETDSDVEYTVDVLDDTTCMTTETVYAQHFPYTGMPLSTTQSLGVNGELISEATNTLDQKTTANSAIFPYIESSSETSYVLSEDLTSSSALSITDSTFGYDTYGNLTSSSNTVKDPSSPTSDYLTTVTFNTYGTTDKYKQLGRLTNTSVEKTLHVSGSAIAISPGNSIINRTSSFTYNGDLMLKTETVEPDTASVKLVTTHGYDSFGNKISSATVGAAGENASLPQTRSSSSSYDSTRGRFPLTSSNVLGHTSEVEYIGTKGGDKGRIKQIISTGANGITKTTELDEFGSAYKTTITGEGANDPSLVSYTYSVFCSTSGVTCANSDAYIRVIEASAGAPETQTYIDKWGRTVETRVKAFDDTWTVSSQTYNSNGMPETTSEPGKSAASSYVTTIEYDRLRRVIKETKPVGTVSRTYDGATTTTIAETGLIQKETSNYLGQTSQVISANATNAQQSKLVYHYSATGELLAADVYAGNTFSHTQVTNYYDDYGRKTSMTDLDKGTWSYAYNAFGEMVKQTNSSNQNTIITYDTLGRKINSQDDDGYTDWQYDNHDSSVKAKGKLNRVRYYKGQSSASGTANYQESYIYASHGKVLSTDILIDGESFTIENGYDEFNRPYLTAYPANNFTVKQTYTSLGYPESIVNATQGHRDYGVAYETITAMNARGQITSKTLGNGVVESLGYQATTGWLSSLDVAKGGTLHHALDYTYYNNGNLKKRTNNFAYGSAADDFFEEFFYDGLNRLDYSKKTIQGSAVNEDYSYDALGNITYKQGAGYYKYGGTRKNRLLEVWSGSGFTGTKTHDFDYDARGNITDDGTRTFDYTSYDKPYLITKGNTSTAFSYGPSRAMYFQRLTVNGAITDTLYVKGLYERTQLSTGVTEHKYHVGSVVITDRSNDVNDTLYLHKDNLGSTVSITDADGVIKQHFSYDAWGKQTAFYAHSSLVSYISPATSQGYTGHKMLNDVGIIHMNGRIYDPTLGRFLQADPHIQAPKNSQSYNRYSYVLNNPLSYTDPSGYFFDKLFKSINKALGDFAPFVAIAIGVLAGPWAAQGFWNAALVGFASGGVATGSLKGALIGAFSAGVFQQIGAHYKGLGAANVKNGVDGLTKFGGNMLTSTQIAGQIASHAVAGGVISTLSGGKFGHGFFSAGFTKGVGGAFLPAGSDLTSGEVFGGAILSAVLGGTASAISGGKFANGAQTGAFQFLFNQASQRRSNSFSAKGEAKLKSLEGGARLLPYDDQTGQTITSWVKGATIGYGHLISQNEWALYSGGITQAQANALFQSDIAPFVAAVNNSLSVNVSQQQFDAAVILAYNIGVSGFTNSSALALINNPAATTPYANLETAWKAWNQSQGAVSQGLINRRNAEWDIYANGNY
ncbi:FG-GAP-like repeat-containing protein [Paraglaciecola sp.]|uniref:FG-GAP-like repeat-containing protein n=1 Tax=Paraglaciecola sp. TaxID=1920173 RepID=UPI0032677859